VVARSPSQSPNDEKTIEFQSLRNAGIARTLRVTSCAGASGVGKLFGMWEVYRARQRRYIGLQMACIDRELQVAHLSVVLRLPYDNRCTQNKANCWQEESKCERACSESR
jgi:hypothetical protein